MSKILNNLICTVAIFALSFLWIYYSVKSVVWAVTLGTVIALCAAYLIWRIQNKSGKLKQIKMQNKKAVENLNDFLMYSHNNAELLGDLYRYYGYEVTNVDYDSFIVTRSNSSTYVCADFTDNTVSANAVRAAIVNAKRNNIQTLRMFVCKVDEPTRKTACRHFDVSFVDVANLYALLEQSEKLPIIPQAKKQNNGFVAKYAFCRKRSVWYLTSCIFLTLISVVAYFPYYTLGWATVMLILALYSMFNRRFNPTQTSVSLDQLG